MKRTGRLGRRAIEGRGGGGATDPRHDDIKDGERRHLGFAKAKGLLAVGGSQNTVAEADDGLTDHFADGIVVFGDEDGLATLEIESGRRLRGGTARRARPCSRQEASRREKFSG